MLTHKKNRQPAAKPEDISVYADDTPSSSEAIPFPGNPMVDIYRAVEAIIKSIPKDCDNPEGEKYFKTVKWNMGQLGRIKSSTSNEEYGNIAFPAVFIHFINVRGLVATSRIGEFRAECRIQYVLNRLNNGDDEYQTEGVEVFQLINNAINENKSKFSALTERFQFTYWDQPESFSDALQQYWITYEVWFRDYSSYYYKDYVDAYFVAPPFTNHSDQIPEANPNNHENHLDGDLDSAAGIEKPVG